MAEHEFKAGDQVAHVNPGGHGNGVIIGEEHFSGLPEVEFESGKIAAILPEYLRPRNFLPKIEEDKESKTVDQQFNEVFKDAAAHGTGVVKDGKHVPHSEVFDTDRFQRNAYGQLVDTVTGLSADSDGIVTITSIRDSVREIS